MPRQGVVTRQASALSISGPLDFQQILLPLLSGMVGGVTGVGAGADKTWTFTPSTSAPAALDSYTLEYAERSPDDTAELENAYGITDSIEITASPDNMTQMAWTMFGRAATGATMTAGQAVPTLELAAPARWGVFVDNSFAGIGATQHLAQIYGFRWSYKGATHPGYYLDNRTTLDFSTEEYGRPECEIEMDVVHDPNSGKFVQGSETDKTNQTVKFIELRLTGATLGAGAYSIKLQGAFYHMADSMEERGNDRDGNQVVRVHYGSTYDPTSSQQVKVIVVNNLATFP